MKSREEQRHAYRPISTRTKKKTYLMLLSVIAGCIKNRLLLLVMETVNRDGREAHRKLDAEYRPTCRGRHMALLRRIMRPHLNSAGSDVECVDKLSEWQQVVRHTQQHTTTHNNTQHHTTTHNTTTQQHTTQQHTHTQQHNNTTHNTQHGTHNTRFRHVRHA